jgi:O-antigen/teichoic acid export membrane protein
MKPGGLAKALTAGLSVDLASALLLRGLALATTIVVARTLAPASYGAVSLALAVYGVSDTLTNPALGVAVIRRQELDDRTIDVAWTLTLLRSAALGLAIYVAAPLLADLWHGDAETASYLRILSLAPVTGALGNMHAIRLQRALLFGKALLLDNARLLATALVSLVWLAVTGRASSLVLGIVIGNLIYVALSWALISPRPRLAFSASTARELTQVSRWLMLHGVLVYLSVTVDNLYVGRSLGLAALGAYALAWRIVNTFMTLFTRAIAKMLIPTYQRMGNDLEQLRRTVLGALFPSAAVGALATGVIVASASDIFHVVGGKGSYPGAAAIAAALTPYVYTRIVNNVLSPLYQGVGSPRMLASLSGLNFTLLIPAIVVGARLYAATGVAIAVSSVAIVVTTVLVLAVRKRFDLSLGIQLKATVLPLLLVAPAALVGHFANQPFSQAGLRLGVTAVVTGSLFLASWEVSRLAVNDLPSLVQPILTLVNRRRARRIPAQDSPNASP